MYKFNKLLNVVSVLVLVLMASVSMYVNLQADGKRTNESYGDFFARATNKDLVTETSILQARRKTNLARGTKANIRYWQAMITAEQKKRDEFAKLQKLSPEDLNKQIANLEKQVQDLEKKQTGLFRWLGWKNRENEIMQLQNKLKKLQAQEQTRNLVVGTPQTTLPTQRTQPLPSGFLPYDQMQRLLQAKQQQLTPQQLAARQQASTTETRAQKLTAHQQAQMEAERRTATTGDPLTKAFKGAGLKVRSASVSQRAKKVSRSKP